MKVTIQIKEQIEVQDAVHCGYGCDYRRLEGCTRFKRKDGKPKSLKYDDVVRLYYRLQPCKDAEVKP